MILDMLPPGWARVRLGDICVPALKVHPAELGRESFQYVDIGSIDNSSFSVASPASTPVQAAPSRARQVVHAGDTVFSTVRPYLKKVAYIGPELDGEIASTGFCIIRPSAGIERRFIFHLVTSNWFINQVTRQQYGASYPAVRDEHILGIEIPLPPLAEQQRIVEVLEGQLSRLKAGLAGLDRVITLLSSWRDSTLAQAFHGALTEDDLSEGTALQLPVRFRADSIQGPWRIPNEWAWRRMGDLFKVSVGATPSRSNTSFWDGDIPWVSSGEVAFGRINHTHESISIDALANPDNRIHPPGTVLLAMIGEGKTRGQAAILDIAAAHNQNSASIRVSETPVLPEYVYWFLFSRYNENRRAASGGNQPALSKAKVENILIPLAPLGTQRRIVSILQYVDQQITRTRNSITQVINYTQSLKERTLDAAFSGLLVPQEPTDEPATVLLEAIKARQPLVERRDARRSP
jgi:type I restriction enzyme S subunit